MLSSSQVDALLLDLGLVLRHISSSSGASTAPAAAGIGHAAIAEKARRLIAFACDQGWVAVASAVLPWRLRAARVRMTSWQPSTTPQHRWVAAMI